jgi:hypothetical protein
MILRPDQSVGALHVHEQGTNEKTTVSVVGAAASLNNKYFIFSSSGVNYYAWFDYNSTGVDPAVAGKTAVQVAIGVGATTAQIATAAASAIDALALVTSSADGSDINIKADANGAITDAGAGNSGFTVNIVNQGRAAYGDYPSKAVSSYSNTPSAVS